MKKSVFRNTFLYTVAGVAFVTSSISPLAAAEPAPAATEIQAAVGESLATAPFAKIEKALAALIKKNPAGAAGYVEAILKAGREQSGKEAAQLVGIAIAALGENPAQDSVLAILLKAIELLPAMDAPAIVGAAVKAAPAEMAAILVEKAVAAVPDPAQLVEGRITLAEAIVNAALAARPDLDPAELSRAAVRGFEQSLGSQFAAIAYEIRRVFRYADQPDRATVTMSTVVAPPEEAPASP